MNNHYYKEYLSRSNRGHRVGEPERPDNALSYVKSRPFSDDDLVEVKVTALPNGYFEITFPDGRKETWWFHEKERKGFVNREGYKFEVHEESYTLVSYAPMGTRNPTIPLDSFDPTAGIRRYQLMWYYECSDAPTKCSKDCL